jgi:protein-S-isoprenylcysteine O-methyltransferase Ste14
MSSVSPEMRLVVLGVAWGFWWAAFAVKGKRHHEKAVRKESKARWGIGLQMVGYFLVFTHGPEEWRSGVSTWRLALGIILAILSNVAVWGAVGNLGTQWRVDAGLNQNHELVQTGAYRFVRHPIYASMLGMLVATICWIGTLPGWPIGLVLCIAGTEVRVRTEDGLLRDRFGDRFVRWQKSLPAYLPFVR